MTMYDTDALLVVRDALKALQKQKRTQAAKAAIQTIIDKTDVILADAIQAKKLLKEAA